MSKELQPFFAEVQAHYDVSDAFYELFLDPSLTYSCAFFREPSMSLEEAQLAKIDLALSKCHLESGQTLLDIGCGWGSTAIRAANQYDVRVVGLTLSENQWAYASDLEVTSENSVEFRLQGWEDYFESVDRIVSIGAFEHFRNERQMAFFDRCYSLLPTDGRMLLQSIVLSSFSTLEELGIKLTAEDMDFSKFMRREVFPGGQLCTPERIEDLAREARFVVEHAESFRMHYARTLDCWADNLASARDRAVELTSIDVYERYMKYLVGCAEYFRQGNIDVMQFQLRRA